MSTTNIIKTSKTQSYVSPSDKLYYKALRKDLQHFNFTYKLGTNILKEPFDSSPDCSAGALYMCDLQDIEQWIDLYDDIKYIATIKLFPDSSVIKLYQKYKTDKFEIIKITEITEFLIKHNLLDDSIRGYKVLPNINFLIPDDNICNKLSKIDIPKYVNLVEHFSGDTSYYIKLTDSNKHVFDFLGKYQILYVYKPDSLKKNFQRLAFMYKLLK